jgi:hypothetical protein
LPLACEHPAQTKTLDAMLSGQREATERAQYPAERTIAEITKKRRSR